MAGAAHGFFDLHALAGRLGEVAAAEAVGGDVFGFDARRFRPAV